MRSGLVTIDNQDITVVVQGPIIGSIHDSPEDRYTKICLQSIRKYLPKAKIILSTWEGSDVRDLEYDILVENKDPGVSIMGDFSPNCFRQIVSSINGLKRCNTKYAVKMRSDLILKGKDFLKFFVQYNLLPFNDKYKILNQRVVMLTTCNPKRRYKFPFNASDWFYFGLTEDLIKIFDIPLVRGKFFKKKETGEESFVESHYSAEQYIWFGFISKYAQIPFKHFMDVSGNNIELSEKYFANNAILLTARQAKIDWLKYPGAAYAQIPCLSNSGLYTFNDYKKMLNKYANCSLFVVPNIFEELIYFIVYNLRFFVKNKNPKLYDFICRLVNRDNHLRVERNIQKLKESDMK